MTTVAVAHSIGWVVVGIASLAIVLGFVAIVAELFVTPPHDGGHT